MPTLRICADSRAARQYSCGLSGGATCPMPASGLCPSAGAHVSELTCMQDSIWPRPIWAHDHRHKLHAVIIDGPGRFASYGSLYASAETGPPATQTEKYMPSSMVNCMNRLPPQPHVPAAYTGSRIDGQLVHGSKQARHPSRSLLCGSKGGLEAVNAAAALRDARAGG